MFNYHLHFVNMKSLSILRKVCFTKFTVSSNPSISLQPGDRVEEQLPSPERAGQGERHLTFIMLLTRGSAKATLLVLWPCVEKSKDIKPNNILKLFKLFKM